MYTLTKVTTCISEAELFSALRTAGLLEPGVHRFTGTHGNNGGKTFYFESSGSR